MRGIKVDFNATLEQKTFQTTIFSSGEKNTASNVGDGAGIAKTKSGLDLPLRTLKSLSPELIISQNTDTIDFSVIIDVGDLNQEQLEDMIGAMVTDNVEIGIVVSYDDNAGKLNFDASHNHDLLYAALAHNHDLLYSALAHNHDADYATIIHNHDLAYATIIHNHDADYADIAHNHDADYSA